MRRISPVVAIFLTVFLDILSFGSVIPDVQLRAEKLTRTANWFGFNFSHLDDKAVGFLIGLTLALYSIAQFAIAPYLGRLSDQVGRRRVLIVTCTLSVFAAASYAFATSLAVMWISRILLGLAAGNLGVAYAYASDISSDKDRSKTMGLLGMAFGLGFMLGPPAGAFLIQLGQGSPAPLGWGSALFAAINLAFVVFFMPEPEKKDQSPAPMGKQNRFEALQKAFTIPGLRLLLTLFFVANFAFANLESTFYRVGEDVYKVEVWETTLVLVFVGILAAVVQGGLIRFLEPRFGERNLIKVGYILLVPALMAVPLVPWGPLVFLGAGTIGLANGIIQPSLNSLVSKAAPVAMVGGIFGVTQSLGAFARIFSPVLANSLYGISPAAPYLFASLLMLGPTVMAWFIPKSEETDDEQEDSAPNGILSVVETPGD